MTAPLSHSYNLNRLGQAGDTVVITATDEECRALAAFAGILKVEKFTSRVLLKKASPNRFALDFVFEAVIAQACVVSLVEVPARLEKHFHRDLHFSPARSHAQTEIVISPEEDDQPEEIASLHYDLAGPLIEEFVLALDPYPRAPGIRFAPPENATPGSESPFAALKGLKSRS